METIRKEDSENVMSVLDESRDILKDSYEEFKREQDEYRQQLEDIARQKEAILGRRKGKRFNEVVGLRKVFLKKMPFHCQSSCDRNVILKVLLIFVRIPV